MTEGDWLASNDPGAMLESLRFAGQLSERKLRLFAVACCRRVSHLLTDERSRRAVVVAERYADGQAADEDVTRGWMEAAAVATNRAAPADGVSYATLAASVAVMRQSDTFYNWAREVTALLSRSEPFQGGKHAQSHADFLRCIFGSRRLQPITSVPTWLTWNHGTVPAIARHVYDDRAFHDMPILADALEDAGCMDAAILSHCRGDGPHVMGCWVVDLLLGRE